MREEYRRMFPKTNVFERLPDDVKQSITQRFAAGESMVSIANALGISVGRLRNWTQRRLIPRPPQQSDDEGDEKKSGDEVGLDDASQLE
jgi:transposase-like protein